jgi:hypothetical protein
VTHFNLYFHTLLLSCFIVCCERAPLDTIDWEKPTLKVAQDLLNNPKYHASKQDILAHISRTQSDDQWKWFVYTSQVLFKQHREDLKLLCNMINESYWQRLKKIYDQHSHKKEFPLLSEVLKASNECKSITKIDQNIKKYQMKINEINHLEKEAERAIDKEKKERRYLKMSLEDFLVLTGYVTSTYGQGVYEISTPKLYNADKWSCANSITCKSHNYVSPLRINLGVRVLLILENYHFKTTGLIKVMVKSKGMQSISLKTGGQDQWFSYQEAKLRDYEQIKANLQRLEPKMKRIEASHLKAKAKAKEIVSEHRSLIHQLKIEKSSLISRFKNSKFNHQKKVEEVTQKKRAFGKVIQNKQSVDEIVKSKKKVEKTIQQKRETEEFKRRIIKAEQKAKEAQKQAQELIQQAEKSRKLEEALARSKAEEIRKEFERKRQLARWLGC